MKCYCLAFLEDVLTLVVDVHRWLATKCLKSEMRMAAHLSKFGVIRLWSYIHTSLFSIPAVERGAAATILWFWSRNLIRLLLHYCRLGKLEQHLFRTKELSGPVIGCECSQIRPQHHEDILGRLISFFNASTHTSLSW